MGYRGKSLRALREQKRIQLARIARETRITRAYLEAIEEERFDRFPGRFYFKSFTREYARALGLEPGEVLRDLAPAYDEWAARRTGPPQRDGAAATEPERRRSGLVGRLAERFRRVAEV